MILVLACFDLAVVTVSHPLLIVTMVSCWRPGTCDELVEISQWFEPLFAFPLTALLTMTVERYLALVHPFFHQKFATRSRLIGILLVFQLPFGIFCISRDPEDHTREYIVASLGLTLIGTAFLVICGINIKLFCLARTLRQRVDIRLGSSTGSEERITRSNKFKLTFPNFGKISTCLLAIVCLFICYCPFFVVVGLELTNHANEIKISELYIFRFWADTFITLNSTLNCLIFFYKNSALRRHAMNLLGKCVLCA
jgi:hypothetical protein